MTQGDKPRTRHLRVSLATCALLAFLVCTSRGQDSQSREDSSEAQCGQWALLRCAELLGVPVTFEQVREVLPDRANGHSMATLAEAAIELGLHCEGRREKTIRALSEERLPVIAHLRQEHFVVVARIDETNVIVYSNGRRQVWPITEFEGKWTHAVLRLWRGEAVLPLTSAPEAYGKARIQFDTLIVDMGEVAGADAVAPVKAAFRNAGKSPLVVYEAVSSCGCLSTESPKAAIIPGDNAEVMFEFDGRGLSGSFSYTVYIRSNDPVTPIVRLTVCGNASRKMSARPPFINLGSVRPGATLLRLVHIEKSAEPADHVRAVECIADGLTMEWRRVNDAAILRVLGKGEEGVIRDGGETLLLKFTVNEGPSGQVLGKVAVKANGDTGNSVEIPLGYAVGQPLGVYPSLLYVGEFMLNDRIKGDVLVAARDGGYVDVVSVEIDELDGCDIKCKREGEGRVRISVSGETKEGMTVGGEMRITVRESQNADITVLRVPVYGLQKTPY